jgi:hypothetical protein
VLKALDIGNKKVLDDLAGRTQDHGRPCGPRHEMSASNGSCGEEEGGQGSSWKTTHQRWGLRGPHPPTPCRQPGEDTSAWAR